LVCLDSSNSRPGSSLVLFAIFKSLRPSRVFLSAEGPAWVDAVKVLLYSSRPWRASVKFALRIPHAAIHRICPASRSTLRQHVRLSGVLNLPCTAPSIGPAASPNSIVWLGSGSSGPKSQTVARIHCRCHHQAMICNGRCPSLGQSDGSLTLLTLADGSPDGSAFYKCRTYNVPDGLTALGGVRWQHKLMPHRHA